MSDRLVHAAYEHCVRQADYVIDLHTTDGTTLPHIRMGQSPIEQELARVFGIPYLVDERHDAVLKRARFDGKLRVVATNDGKPAITPELGGHRRLQKEIAAMGSRGILNVLKHLKVLRGTPELPDKQIVVSYDSTGVLNTNQGGYYIAAVEFGQPVAAGEVIGRLYDLATFDEIAQFTAPFDGVVLSTTEDPARHTGDRVAMICRLEHEVVNGLPS
jgi:predicted deacylase